jgi:RNA polymerase sigma-70 factor (ECF subfamily)
MASSEPTREELEAQLARLHRLSFGWAMSCCGWDEADAEDVLQTTYVKVISGQARFGGRSAFRTWLFGVIRQTAREHYRRARSLKERAERFARDRDDEAAVEGTQDPAEHAEESRMLLEALDQLPARQREVLHLVFYQDLTVKEAAEVMEVSVGSARVHYDRGKKRIRALLSEKGVSGGSR